MVAIKDMEMPKSCGGCNCSGTGVCKEWVYLNGYDLGKKRADTCPLVEIEERKVGKWIYDKTSQNWRCSVCNETPKTLGYVGTADFMAEHFKFCNHCGAEMEGTIETSNN